MRNILFLIVFLVGLFSAVGFAEEVPSGPRAVEFYMEGQKYASLEDYRLEKIRSVLKGVVPKELVEKDPRFMEQLVEELKQKNFEELTKDDIQALVESFREDYLSRQLPDKKEEEDFKAMQAMLDDLKENNPEAEPLEIDPAQIKTIIVPQLRRKQTTSQSEDNPSTQELKDEVPSS